MLTSEPKSLFLHTADSPAPPPKRPSYIYEPPPEVLNAEPWVDLKTVARHIGFSYQTALKMVHQGLIPCTDKPNGARVHRRFQLSAVDAALRKNHAATRPETHDAA